MTSAMDHPHVRRPFRGLDAQLADRINAWFGSMRMFWILVAWMAAWIVLATLGVWLFADDRYPFPFLLFCSNLIQLWALPLLGSTQNRADQKRESKADSDHEALTYLANRVDQIAARVGAPSFRDR